MLDKKNKRWFINVVLVIAVVAFAGFSLALPLSRAFQDNQRDPEVENVPNSESAAANLEAQARSYEIVLEREPDNEVVLRGLLQTRVEMGDVEGAIVPLERLVNLYPERTDYAILLGQAKQEIGDREGAAEVFRDVLSSSPGNMRAMQSLVGLLVQEGRPESAIGLLEDTLKTADDLNQIQAGSIDVASVRLLLGQVYVELGRDDDALAIYDEAIRSSEDDFRPILSKAILLQDLGRDDEAQPLFSSAEALAPAEFKDEIQRLAAGESAEAGDSVNSLTPDITDTPEATSAPTEGDDPAGAIDSEDVPEESDATSP
ncbi:MAG: tetratricopeptide repeat protein [Leptolyngbyaceae bacterium]|nr:tetratricopeptide repeat protein [Leptolyngbyaceae bacterium]